jgi:hypothetical protein
VPFVATDREMAADVAAVLDLLHDGSLAEGL